MAAPIADFLYSPLGGKSPLEITFINQSKNLGATNEWAACTLCKKYFYSALTSPSDNFALDFSGILAVNSTYNENGFRVESNGIHYPGDLYPISNDSNDDLTINCGNDFYIEITINSFNSYYGSIELYFPEITVPMPPYTVNPGIHINTNGGIGIVRGINNIGDIANLSDYTFPIKLKFKKVGDTLYLLINDEIVYDLAATLMGLDSGTHDLR